MQYIGKGDSALGTPYLQQYQGFGRACPNSSIRFHRPLHRREDEARSEHKTILNGNHSFNDFQDNSGQSYIDTTASYNYSYTNSTYAAYSSFTQHLGDRFSYMAGLRFEQYQYSGHHCRQHQRQLQPPHDRPLSQRSS